MSTEEHTPEDPTAAEKAASGAAESAAAGAEQAADAPAASSDAPAETASAAEATDSPEASESETVTPAAPAVPAPRPPATPRPPAMPRPPATAIRPVVPAAPAAPAAVSTSDAAEWGRVTEDGTVSVREADTWREVGQYPDGTPAEALAYFVRKFEDLAFKVNTLEQRVQAGGTGAGDLAKQAQHLVDEVTDAAAVGDLAGLRARLDALTSSLAEASAAEAQEAKAAVDAAIAERTAIVERSEAIAAQDLSSVQWKKVTEEMGALFDAWQNHQQNGPRLPKGVANQLWKRFRDARATVDRQRRAFYAELDETHKAARERKTRLVERAEALAPKGVDGIPAYRGLLDEWKAAGRAGRKADDALWARFKAAGDALYAARAEQAAATEAESAPRIEARTALLEEAKAVADEPDLAKARALLTRIQRQWDEVGRIFPREKERALDDRLRVIEQELKAREDVDWKRNNPETKARAGAMSEQLQQAIAKLEAERDAAQKSGNAKALKEATEALEARRAWLKALGG
ncbi:conserved hypothetical protein [Microbacterium sp. 8M]|uniref:DUF349 domain-containing protein n=1 Tax=Microbacterium sp. 8M TaxID=2653153 RepID=UPI0012F01B49|nr:DUF349 domain-containing protein [Microbacterium sp. 8M]VXC18970.1 conserved hypothetical protein [Microbacterium sp. 8M]